MIKQGSALLVVMSVMTGLTLLLTSLWQAAGWTGDLVLVRQRYIAKFYATEVMRNYAVTWVKKEFDQVSAQLDKTKQPLIMDGGTISFGLKQEYKCTLVVDKIPGDNQANIVRIVVFLMLDGKKVACHRCLLEEELIAGVPRFTVHHVSF